MTTQVPGFPNADFLREALALHQSGHFPAAEKIYLAILDLDPDHFDALQLLGALEVQRRNYQTAIDYLDRALTLKPGYAQGHYHRGVALQALNRLEEALANYDQALSIDPGYLEAQYNRGIALQAIGRFEEALASCNQVLQIRPDNAGAYGNRGTALQALGRFEEALTCFDQALRIKPDDAEAHNNRGNALHSLKRFDEALASYDEALRIRPDYAEAYSNRGGGLQQLGLLKEALASYEQALHIKPQNAAALNNRGFVLQAHGRLEAALASFDQALQIKPDYAVAHHNRGLVLHRLRRLDEALASYEQALRLMPDAAVCHLDKGLCHLLRGEYPQGWKEYEWRWKSDNVKHTRRHAGHPSWPGSQSVVGKRVLLWSEQGFGDTLQFCRYVRAVAELGAAVYLEVPQPLKPLLQGLDGAAQVFGEGDALPEFDYQCPLLSLPLFFKSDEQSISGAPYIAAPSTRRWVDEVLHGLNPRIGVAWSGNANQADDRNRSIPLSRFQSLLPEGLAVVCVQKDIREADRAVLAERPAIRAVDTHLADFSDTAALINELDLVVTTDTSIAHLAGAMGKEVWILLSWAADWRWLLERTDSPWYDSATLFRQPAPGDWDSVLTEVKRKLSERYSRD